MKKKLWLLIAVVVALLAFALYRVGVMSVECGRAATANRILNKLKNDTSEDMDKALTSLVRLGEPAIKPLIAHLGDNGSLSRSAEAAQEALGRMGSLAIEPLRDVLKNNPNEDVRFGAISALGGNKDPRSIGILITAFKDQSRGLREFAAHCFEKKGRQATGPLLAALRDTDKTVRMHSAEALEWSRGGRVVKALMAMLRNRKEWSEARSQAAWTLSRIGDKRGVALVANLLLDKTDDPDVRGSAACALGELKTPEAKKALKAALCDPNADVRESASYALRSAAK